MTLTSSQTGNKSGICYSTILQATRAKQPPRIYYSRKGQYLKAINTCMHSIAAIKIQEV